MRPIVNMSEEDGATDVGNMYKTFGKDRACGSEISLRTDRQTHRQTHKQTYSSQYFATALPRQSSNRNPCYVMDNGTVQKFGKKEIQHDFPVTHCNGPANSVSRSDDCWKPANEGVPVYCRDG